MMDNVYFFTDSQQLMIGRNKQVLFSKRVTRKHSGIDKFTLKPCWDLRTWKNLISSTRFFNSRIYKDLITGVACWIINTKSIFRFAKISATYQVQYVETHS
ncbi:hypothetical protein Dimus_015911 [Dionaea muscipula]